MVTVARQVTAEDVDKGMQVLLQCGVEQQFGGLLHTTQGREESEGWPAYWVGHGEGEDEARENIVDMHCSCPSVHTEQVCLNYDL